MKTTYVMLGGKLVRKDEVPYRFRVLIMPDIVPYQSMVTGEMIGSRSTHRDHLKQHGMFEIGTEYDKGLPDHPPPSGKKEIVKILKRKLNV